MEIKKCICCGSDNLKLLINLGNQPWCNNFLTKNQVGKEEYYPLQLMECRGCKFNQLSYFVPKEKMFSHHDYLSGITKTLRKHFKEIAEDAVTFSSIHHDDLILDIGGNDGTNLETYKELGYNNIVNVEAATNISEISKNKGINTHNEFFNEDYIDKYHYNNNIKIINASGVFFHLEEIHSVIKGIKKSLHNDGVLVVQFMYVLDMLKNKTFDMIYHEHLFYYTIQSLENLLKKYDLEIVHCYHSDIHSGSMIAYIKHSSPNNKKTDSYVKYKTEEQTYLETNPFEQFIKEITLNKNKLKETLQLIKLKNPSSKIYALGAPAKGNTLMNYFDIKGLVDKVHEVNELKIGKYTPHTHIPIEKESLEDSPDYYLVLAHNFFDEIVEKNKHLKEKGVKFIMPFPKTKII
jgi:hypothetical protein